MAKFWSMMVVACCCSLLSACSGGGGSGAGAPTQTTDTFVAESKTLVIGPSGGGVTHSLADGTVFQLDFPAGALTTDTTLTLTTQAPVAGQRFNLLLQPAGLLLANGAVGTLTITLPAGQTLPATGGLVYDGTLIPYTILPDGSLQISLSAFAGSTVATVAARLTSARAATTACGDAPALDTAGGLAAVDAVELATYGACMVNAVNALASNAKFTEAVHMATAVAAYLSRAGAVSSSDAFIVQASDIACTASGVALDHARATPVTGMGVLYDLIKPILFWQDAIVTLSAPCTSIPVDEYKTVINAKTAEAIAYYAQQKPSLTDISSSNYTQARSEAAASAQTKNEVLALNPPEAVRTTLHSEVTQRAQSSLLDAMLQAPWQRCHDSSDYLELARLMTTLDNPDSVKSAAQYCGTILHAQTKKFDGSPLADLNPGLGGVSVGVARTRDRIDAAKNGLLTLSGPIQALYCPPGYVGGSQDEALTLKIDGTVIATLTSPPYLNNALPIDLAAALEAAHPGATAQLNQATLTVERTGTPCSGFWGSSPAPLLTLTLSLSPGKIAFTRADGIYVMESDGSGITKILSTVAGGGLAMSRDHGRIAFGIGANIVVSSGISVMNIDGSGVTQVTRHPPFDTRLGGTVDIEPTWSPDGTRIAFVRGSSGVVGTNLYVMNADGTGLTVVPTGLDPLFSEVRLPDWSPDGTRIAFTYGDHIYVVNANGGGLARLVNSGVGSAPAWSPDGARIAFKGGEGIYVMNADGSGQSKLTSIISFSYGGFPAWSPDGTRIAFYRYDGGNSIFVMNSDGSGVVLLTSGFEPVW